MIFSTQTGRRSKRVPKPENVPSPERIRELTEEIRKTWTIRDYCRRSNSIDHVELMQMPLEPRRRGFWGE